MTGEATEAMLSPLLRPWRRHQRLAVLRLKIDVAGASLIPARRAGDIVLATWSPGNHGLAKGWQIRGVDFLAIVNGSDVEVIERP